MEIFLSLAMSAGGKQRSGVQVWEVDFNILASEKKIRKRLEHFFV